MTAKLNILPTLDPVAFALALVMAPLVVALLFFWALLIPVLALPFGVLPYLVFGVPVLLGMVTRYPPAKGTFALAGVMAQVLFLACLSVWGAVAGADVLGALIFLALFGLPMAALWFAAFAVLYRRFWRPVLPLRPALVALA